MENILPIGSILEKEENKAVILGYQVFGKEDLKVLYLCAPYPFGYICEDECFYVPADMEFDIINIGYESEQYHQFIDLLCEVKDACIEFGTEEINKSIEEIFDELSKKIILEEGGLQ